MQANSIVHATILTVTIIATSLAAPPVGWRNNGSGKFPKANPPINWASDRNVLWRVEMSGRSLASPIIVGNRVFVTVEPAELVCFSTKDGKKLWQRSQQYGDLFEKAKADRIENDLPPNVVPS